jgi:hypothetical protein
MKTLDVKKVEAATKAAMIAYTKAFISQAKLHIAMITACFIISLSISAQNFKTIDFRGKTSSELPKLCYAIQFLSGVHNWVDENGKTDPNGEEVMTFRGYDFQNVWYQFDKKGICYKIIIRNHIDHPIIFDKSVDYKVAYEDGVIVYTIEK